MELRGKTALVTGAAKRIGRSIALLLAQEGMHLLLHYHHSRREIENTRKSVEAHGVRADLLRADLGNFSEVKTLIRKAFKISPQISVLINNASIFYRTPVGKIREQDWDDFFSVNLKTPFFLAEAVGLRMARRKEGKIINLIDWTAFRPRADFIPYCASKAGLVAVTQGLALALAPHVQVNGIAPGPILPPDKGAQTEQAKVIRRTPLKRYGDPGDIVEAVRFLVQSTDYVTGTILPVDGGNLVV